VLPSARDRIAGSVGDDDLVLDVGGWAEPFARADWVIDLEPYATRGLYGDRIAAGAERFTADTWVVRDICDRERWPFHDGQFAFAICAHTLEEGMASGKIKGDADSYQLLANCYIASRDTDKALAPLARAGELSTDGKGYLLLGQLLAIERYEIHRVDHQRREAAIAHRVADDLAREREQ